MDFACTAGTPHKSTKLCTACDIFSGSSRFISWGYGSVTSIGMAHLLYYGFYAKFCSICVALWGHVTSMVSRAFRF